MSPDGKRPQDADENLLFDESFFEDDDIGYPEFDENFDCDVIIPIEYDIGLSPVLAEPVAAKQGKAHRKINVFQVLSFIAMFTEAVGESTIRLVTSFVSKFGFIFAFPFVMLFRGAKRALAHLRLFFVNAPGGFVNELRSIREELSAIKRGARTQNEKARASLLRALAKYFLLSFTRHDKFWKTLFNTAFPVFACIVLALTLSDSRRSVLALDVTLVGEHLGYIEQEDTFEEAKALALEMLPDDIGESGSSFAPISAEPLYTLKKVGAGELSNSSMICEKLLSASGSALVRACGIYIDGEFLCAVRNEADAASVFDSIIAPVKKTADSDCVVAFVEEIDYVQGLYPDNEKTIWDSYKLKTTLSRHETSAKYYKVKKGDTASSVAKRHSLSLGKLYALNPGVNFSKKLKRNTRLLVRAQSDYVRVKVMKAETSVQKIPYEKVTQESSSMLKGTKKISRQGQYGEKQITTLVTYINGVRTYSTVVSEKQTKAPVNEVTLVGTKSPYSGYSGYSYYQSYGYYSGFAWPTRGAYSLSSGYGYRSASISGWSYHGGIDIVRGGPSSGIPVVASASGTVVTAYAGSTGYGNTVVIDHGNGYQTRYAHMQWGSICVYPGQKVYQGQQIGRIGATGNATGPHLHFEILKNGSKVNPLPYIS